jgi:hypothetical protein
MRIKDSPDDLLYVLPDMIYEDTRTRNEERALPACVMTDWRIVPTFIAQR